MKQWKVEDSIIAQIKTTFLVFLGILQEFCTSKRYEGPKLRIPSRDNTNRFFEDPK